MNTEIARQIAGRLLVAASLLGTVACGPVISTRNETVVGASHERRVLGGHQLSPIDSEWRVEPDGFEGQLGFRRACVVEKTEQLTNRNVTEAKSNKPAGVVWTSIGAAAVLTSVYFISQAASMSDQAVCDDESDEACSSPKEKVIRGSILLGASGLSLGAYGVLELSRGTSVAVSNSRAHSQTSRGTTPITCADASALDGMELAVQVSETTTLTGSVDAKGKARIAIPPGTRAPVGVPLVVVATHVPKSASAYVRSGAVVGTVTVSEHFAQLAESVEHGETARAKAAKRSAKRAGSHADLGY